MLGNGSLTTSTGVSSGVAWQQGAVGLNAAFSLSAKGSNLPLQSWPLAYWPDSSIKWIGLATVLPVRALGPVSLSTGTVSFSAGTLSVKNDSKSVTVDTDALNCTIPIRVSNIIDSMSISGKNVAGPSQLVSILQSGPADNREDSPKRKRYVGNVKHVTVEQQSPVRAVAKIEDMHCGWTTYRYR